MLPVLEVSRLSSASSFYSAISQPLRIRYLASFPAPAQSTFSKSEPSASSAVSIAQPALTFGSADDKKVVFQIRQVAPTRDRPLRKSHLVLAADSLDAVNDFHAAALKAYPRSSAVIGTRASLESDTATAIGSVSASAPLEKSDICARVTDFDGNIMEAAYMPASYSYPSYHGGSSPSRYRSAHDYDYDHDQDSRVLYYSYEPSPSEPFSPRGSRYHEMPSSYDYRYHEASSPSSRSRYHGGSEHTPTLRRSATSTSAASYDVPSSSRYAPRESYKGMSTVGSMLGMAAVGAAAGAAITYSVMRSRSRSRSSSSRPREYDEATAVPSFQRRSTFPDTYQEYSSSRYSSHEGMRGRPQKETRQVEPAYEYDIGGRTSSRHRSGGGSVSGSRSRARSEAAYDRAPLMLADGDARAGTGGGSYISSRHGGSVLPSHALPSSRRGSTFEYHADPVVGADRDSHVSVARSHRTVRGSGTGGSRLPPAPPNASRSASVRQSMSRTGSYMSARNVPLPPSGVGSSYAQWEEDGRYADDDRFLYDNDDNDSVAPSDSISCVGSRSHSHAHRR